jgi:glycosyltransferase involved in cell wall biosynthesis
MKLRVAYDISVLAHYFNYLDSKSGIYRVYEEVMYELSKRDDVQLTAVGLCGDDLLLNAIKSRLHMEDVKDRIACEFADSFQTNFGLTKFYERIFCTYLSKEFTAVPKIALRSFYIRGLGRILYLLQTSRGPIKTDPVFDSTKFDVFHSPHFRLPPEELTKDVPRVLTIYDLIPIHGTGFVPSFSTTSFHRILDSINLERDWIIAISEFTKHEFCEYTGMSPERVFVAPLAAANHLRRVENPEELAAMRQRYSIPEGDYLLSVSSLEPRRNLIQVIRCFFRLLREHPELEVNLVLAGRKGYLEDRIVSEVEGAPDFRDRVIFTGYVPDEDLSALYSGATAFVYASLYEGFGLPPLEAMQCGIPVITSNSSALPEVVDDAGIMVDPEDADALSQAMLDVLTNAELRSRLQSKGLARAAGFSWAKCAADTVKVYQTAVAHRESSGVSQTRHVTQKAS